jgi:hypothetical protein
MGKVLLSRHLWDSSTLYPILPLLLLAHPQSAAPENFKNGESQMKYAKQILKGLLE